MKDILICLTILFFSVSLLAEERPNIILIVTVDQPRNTWQAMPYTKATLVDQGLEFQRAYVTTPLCCPSRSAIFSGLYNYRNGVHGNTDIFTGSPSLFVEAKNAGYQVGIIGKLLNTYIQNRANFDPYFDFKRIHEASSNYDYLNPDINGAIVENPHIHQLYKNLFLEFFSGQDKSEPFFLYFAPWSPHRPAIPEPEDLNFFGSVDQQSFKLQQLETLRGLDRVINDLLKYVDLKNTIVAYISDNGLMNGQKGLSGKGVFWEPVINVPFVMRADGRINHGVSQNLVANIDLLPTIFQLAGLEFPSDIDGIDCLTEQREVLRLESWKTPVSNKWRAIHTGEKILIRQRGRWSQYDVIKDQEQNFPEKISNKLKRRWKEEFQK